MGFSVGTAAYASGARETVSAGECCGRVQRAGSGAVQRQRRDYVSWRGNSAWATGSRLFTGNLTVNATRFSLPIISGETSNNRTSGPE